MKKNPKKNILTASILLFAALLFIVFNVMSSTMFKALRLDLTGDKLYTLSAGSKEIIKEIKEPIIIRLYFSKQMANINPYLVSFATRVQDLLYQYQRASKGKIVVDIIDPEPFSAAEDEAVNYGLQGVPIDSTGTEFYLGMVITDSLNAKQVIPFLQPSREPNLEYDVSQTIYKLIHPQLRTIGVFSSMPMAGSYSARPWAVWQQMEQLFDLKMLDNSTAEIPANIDTIMLVEPSTFSQSALQAIDKFVMRGGHVLAFVDPLSEVVDKRTAQVNKNKQTNAGDYLSLLHSWGIAFDDNKVVADKDLAKSVRAPYEGREVTVRYPLWMDFTSDNFAKEDILSASLDRVTLATPGSLVRAENATTAFTPLISTSSEATLLDSGRIAAYQSNLQLLFNEYAPQGQFVVAARINGPLTSAFTDAKVGDSNIIVIADTDMLHDHFWINTQSIMGQEYAVAAASNGNLVVSALDNLSGSNALISIRNRGGFARPFETVQKLELASQQKYRDSEQALQEKLQITKQKLEALESQKREGNSTTLSAQQRKTEESFREELVETRKELREVRRKLNHDIESVATGIKFFTVAFIPLLIVVSGLVVWALQIQREVKSRRAICSGPKH